jgi:hypothetical protein
MGWWEDQWKQIRGHLKWEILREAATHVFPYVKPLGAFVLLGLYRLVINFGNIPPHLWIEVLIFVGYLILWYFLIHKKKPHEKIAVPENSNLAPASPTNPTAQSNIRCVAVRSTRLLRSGHAMEENEQGDFSFLATIRNEATPQGSAPAKNVSASMSFLHNGREIYSGMGAWAGRFQNIVSLRAGEEAKLVLIYLDENSQTAYAISNSRRSPLPPRARQAIQTLEQIENISRQVIADDNILIRATLTDGDGNWLGRFEFNYQWNNGNIAITSV